jgi:hypothetical protein
LGEEFELGVLWDEYGIVGDVIVIFSYGYICQSLLIASHV